MVELNDGEIHTWMMFEVLATSEKATRESLKEHVENLCGLDVVDPLEKEYGDITEVEKPMENVEKGYSQVAEVEMVVDSFAPLIHLLINYAPSSLEILAPNELTIDLKDLQDGCYGVIELMQKFMRAGLGGAIMTRHDHDGADAAVT